ncbi:aspartate aminotransferase family protein [Lysinibacillus halotolerans]|uniref:Aspartate aminotransferase family protein n=1 Tax=Lysinibacillus halotolerans TaxID=1368476 RepID=A0A3M8H4B9_9BACI|nr:aspartate aminotransferase family protein [Lysinibacillus halotolerans]RNC97253.1 aspartate aminotransferase family protein [Lysinibacillus halotolerans]
MKTVQKEYYNYLTKNTWPNSYTELAVRGEGLYFWDEKGKKYMDFSSQTLNLLLGQCYPAIVEAIVNQAKNLTYVSSRFGTNVYLEAAKLLQKIAPKDLSKVNIKMCDGSDANETAVKTARKYTGKSGVITFNGIHTGQTTQTIQLRGYDRNPRTLIGNEEDVYFVHPPECKTTNDYLNTLDEVRNLLENNNNIAAILVDPIMVNAGVLVNEGTKEYLQGLNQLCVEYGVLFILDENQSFGWVPGLFATNYFDLNPDIITLGKGLSGGHPLAGVIIKENFDGVLDYNEADFTHGGHPLTCAATVATLNTLINKDFYIKEKSEFLEKHMVEFISNTSLKIKHRGIGLIQCLDFSNLDNSEEKLAFFYNKLLEKGIFLRMYKNKLIFKPSIIVTYEEIQKLFDIINKVGAEIEWN